MDLLLCVPHAGPHVGGKWSQSLFAVAGRPFIVCLSACLLLSLLSQVFLHQGSLAKRTGTRNQIEKKDNG